MEAEKNSGPLVVTSCRDCCFAVMQGEPGKSTQVSCTLNRLEKFKKLGVSVELPKLFAEDNCDCGSCEEERNSDRYYSIDRYCAARRPVFWANERHPDSLANDVRLELNVKWDAVIFFDSKSTKQELKDTITSLFDQSILPNKIVVISYKSLARPTDLIDAVKTLLAGSGVKWSLDTIVADISELDAIDNGVRFSEAPYYLTCIAGSKLPANYVYLIDKSINDNLWPTLFVPAGSDGNNMFVQRHLHNLVVGNKGEPIQNKVYFFAEEQKCPQVIKTWEQLQSQE